MIARILRGRAITRMVTLLSLAVPLVSLADFQMTNPVTGETESYTWKFVGTDTWNGTQYWRNSSGANPSAVPAKSKDNTWDPILFDGNNININASMSVEGWNIRMGVYNGANITMNTFVKIQGGTTMWMTVDDKSQLTVAGFGNGNIGDNQIVRLSSAKAEGIKWTVDLTSTAQQINNTFEYYLSGEGSVAYKAVSVCSHKIKMADVTLIGGEKEVKSKTLVSFTSTSRTFSADATIKVKNSNGDLIDTVSLTSIASDATTLTTDRAVGACELVSTSTGILLYYVDGEPEGPTVVEDGGVYEISAPLVDAVQIACDGSFTITGTDSYTVTETDLAKLTLNAVTGTVTLGAYTCYALDSSRTLPAAYAFGEGSAVKIAETTAEYGTGVFAVSGLTGVSTVVLTRVDGTSEEIAVTEGVASLNSPVQVSGLATWCDYEFNGDKSNSGTDTTGLTSDVNTTTYPEIFNDSMLYTYTHPWRNISYPNSWTAVVRCTVPELENAVVVMFGTYGAGAIGLIAGPNPEEEMLLVSTPGSSATTSEAKHFTTLATMSVKDATTAQHVYVFTKDGTTVNVYCDGEKVLDNYTLDSATLGGGLQVGSLHGGVVQSGVHTGLIRFGAGEDQISSLTLAQQQNARIDCMRMFDYIVSPEQIAALSVEFPAVKLYRATAAADTDTTWGNLTWTPAWDGGNTQSKVILTTEGDATIELPESITVNEVQLNLAADSTLTLVGPGSLAVTQPITIGNGTLELTGTVTLAQDTAFNGSVVFNGFTKAGDGDIQLSNGATVGVDAELVVTPLGTYTCAEGTVADSAYTGEGVKLVPLTSAVVSITQSGTTMYYSDLDTALTTLMTIADVSDDVSCVLLNGTTLPTTPQDYATMLRTIGYYVDGNTITKAVARIGSTTYPTLAAAVDAAAEDATVTLLCASSEAITLDKAITLDENGKEFSGTLGGSGTLTFKTFRNNPSITFDNWTGTVAIPAVTDDVGLDLNSYGTEGSTVRVADLSGSVWLAFHAVLPTVEIPEDCSIALGGFSTSFENTFNKLTGAGSFSLLKEAGSNAHGYFLLKDVSEFTGSITVVGPGLAIGAEKPARTTYQEIVVTVPVTVCAGATWSAPKGVVLASTDATLTVQSGATVTADEGNPSVKLPTALKEEGYILATSEGADGSTVYSVVPVVAKIGDDPYTTLAAAVAAAQDGDTVVVVADVTLDARVEPDLGAGTELVIDLGGYTITREGTGGNGSAFDVKSGTVTIRNGTIDCTQDDAAIVADGVYAITSRGTAAVTLEDLDVTVDSQAGACAYPLGSSTITIKSGTYANTTTDEYQYHAGWTGMAVNQPNAATQQLFIEGGTFSKVNPELGDDSGKMANFCAAGYISVDNGDGTYTVKAGFWVAEVGGKTYETLAAAVAAAQDGDTVVVVADVTLDARVEPNLGAGTALVIDLGGYTITREGTGGNGSAFDVKSGTVTIRNGAIDCTQDDADIVADGVYAITSRSGSTVYLETLTITVNSECGACVYPFSGSTMTIRSGSYANTTETPYRYKTAWTGMAVNQANESTQALFLEGGSFKQVDPKDGDDSGEMTDFCADGKTTELQNGWYVVVDIPPAGFDDGDGGTFTIAIADQEGIKRPDGKALADVASAATGLTYAQAWALGLLDETTGELEEDLKATIEVTGGEVVVKINGTPRDGYEVWLKVFTKAGLDEDWPAEPTKTYSVANATTAAFDVGTVGFYKVAVKISNALMD